MTDQHPSRLTVQAVSMDFSGLRALDAVSLEVRQGEILGLIGPNGSGKTTLINVMTGMLRPTTGRVLLDDQELTGLRPHQVSRAGIARTFQRVRLFRDLTVRENVEAGAVASGASRREARNLAATLLAEIEGTAWVDRFANELPYGHERLVEIARALATRPRFLVLDEPAAGMDEAESAQLLAKLAKLPQEKGLGMIIIDHDMHLMMRLCHRLHVLASGQMIGAGTPAEVRAMPAVVKAYLGTSTQEASDAAH